MTTAFRLVVETQRQGRREDYDDAHQAFIGRLQGLITALNLPKPRMGNDAFFTPDNYAELPDDVYGFRLQLYLSINIPTDQLAGFQALAQAITQLMPDMTAWCEPMGAEY